MEPEFQGRVSTGQAVLDQDLRGIEVVMGPAGPVLYATTGLQGGQSAHALDPGSLARALPGAVYTPDALQVPGGRGVVSVTLGGETILLREVSAGPQISGHALQPDGSLGSAVQWSLPGDGVVDGLAVANLPDGRAVFYILDAATQHLKGFFWTADGPGGLTAMTGQAAIPVWMTDGARLTVQSMDAMQFVIVAAGGAGGGPGQVAAYQVDPDTGALEARGVAGAPEGLGITAPSALASVTAHGASWVVLAAAESQSISVIRLDSDGSLTATDHLIDSLDTRFGMVQALAAIEIDGHAFVVAGGGDDGLSLFSLLPDGHLLHQASLAQATGLGLEDVAAIALARMGAELQIFVAAEGASGVAQFRVSLDTLGQVIRDTDVVATSHAGGPGDDLLVAGDAGRDQLFGGAGADTLVAGETGVDMTGGAGADLFVMGHAGGVQRILDFDPAVDHLDLSRLPMLRNPAQLQTEPRPDGVALWFGKSEIQIFSVTGARLEMADLWPDGRFHMADHFPVGAAAPPFDPDYAPPATAVAGGPGQDTIIGTAADEVLTGGAGPDTFQLQPGMGSDVIADFAPGEDRLDFSNLSALQLATLTISQQGEDRVIALGGDSVLTVTGVGPNTAPAGAAALRGWLGVGQNLRCDGWLSDAEGLGVFSYQWLRNGAAIEGATLTTLRLGAEDLGAAIAVQISYRDGLGSLETVTSPQSAPVLLPVQAPANQPLVLGGAGRDFIQLGGGTDTVRGLLGDDTLFGTDADELLDGGDGHDVLLGFEGDNTVFSGAGDDYVATRLGNDLVWGSLGNDTLFVSGGDDTVGGGEGDDRIGAGDGDDRAWGGLGNDTVFGAPGADRIAGAPGHDALWGGDGHDVIFGAAGRDSIAGAAGNDTLWLGEGADRAFGSYGDDLILGGAGDDTIYGGAGADTVDAGSGADLIFGVGGADLFVFRAGDGADRILDFTPGEDHIHVKIQGVGFFDLQIAATETGARVVWETGSVVLDGVPAESLGEEDFLFGWTI
jgi:Ca2+-binding RTX toxin-like protein